MVEGLVVDLFVESRVQRHIFRLHSFFKKGHSRPLFLLFLSFLFNLQLVGKTLPMLRFEPRISCVGIDRSTNRATTTANFGSILNMLFNRHAAANWVQGKSKKSCRGQETGCNQGMFLNPGYFRCLCLCFGRMELVIQVYLRSCRADRVNRSV